MRPEAEALGYLIVAGAVEGAQFFEDVVHFGEGEPGVELLLALAVGVEAFGDVADGLLLGFGAGGKWEGIEAAGLVVAWTIFECTPSG